MKLSQLSLSSFRSYRGIDLPLTGSRVLFAGLNGTGKSTIKESIRWCLTGHCDGTDGKGAGAEILIPLGAKSAEASCVIAGIGKVSRSFTEKGGGAFSVDGLTGTSQIQQQALYMKLETQASFLDAVLSTSVFLNLNHVEAKALVLSLLGVRIPVGVNSYTLDELDMHYKQAFEDRKVAKRTLQGWSVPEKPTVQMPTEAAVEAQLTKLRSEVGKLRQAAGATIGTRQAIEAALSHFPGKPTLEDRTDHIATIQAKIAELEAEVVPTVAPAKGDPARVTFLRNRLAAVQNHVPANGCVLDERVACLTPSKQFQMAVRSIDKELEGLTPAQAAAPVVSPLSALRRELSDLQAHQVRRQAALDAYQQAQERQEAIRQELAMLPDTAAQEAAIQALETRIGNGEKLLRDARSHWQAVDASEKALAGRQGAEAEVVRLEALVETLGPKGARVAALEQAMGRFQMAVNPYVEPFGWRIEFSVDPWVVSANGRPVETYSRSEQYRIGIALQLGIAQLSGLNFAVVDEIDMLDVANRGIVTKMIMSAPLDQILVLGTRETTQALPKGLPGYRLEKQDGWTVVAERVIPEVAA